jgi:UDP-N-acetyl-D-mannosaminuronic acid dehydrogenase
VGGHCIPVYPHFLLAADPGFELIELSRRTNDGQVDVAVDRLKAELGSLRDVPVLVLGLTYREGVKELAYSRALPLIARLKSEGARVSAFDPLLSTQETEQLGVIPWEWGATSDARVIVVQTTDQRLDAIDHDRFPDLGLIYDGRWALRDVGLPPGIRLVGVGVPMREGPPIRQPDDPATPEAALAPSRTTR